MSIYFNEKFKQLRKSYDLTQDQIANIFHVSPQSVSRWETGANYPDIELLPHIAMFFKVTLDELIGMELIADEKKSADYISSIRNLLNSGKLYDAVDTARKAVKDYPANYDLQSHLVQALCAVCSDETPESKTNIEKFKDEIITVCERIIKHSTDQNMCLRTKYQLFHQYIKWDMKEEAKKILDTLPSEIWYTKDANAGYVLEGEEWRQNQQVRIIRFTVILGDFMRAYANKADDILRKIECLKAVMQIESLIGGAIYNDDERDSQISHIDNAFQNIRIAELYCEMGDIENALNYTEKATRDSMYHIDQMDKTNADGSNYLAWSTPRNLCWILWEDYLMKPQFDIIRNNEKFIKYFELLKANSHELK